MRRTTSGKRSVAVLTTLILAFTGLLLTPVTAHAVDNPANHRPATWNMLRGTSRWTRVQTLSSTHDVVALQEVPLQLPFGMTRERDLGGVTEYRWDFGGYQRWLYVLRTTSQDLGMVTSFRADQALQITTQNGGYRPLLGVYTTRSNTLFASIHASARGGGDAAPLVHAAQRVATDRRRPWNWAVLGDFNRTPQELDGAGLPADTFLYNPGQGTQDSGRELDYLVSSVHTENWQATVLSNTDSDHWPVGFAAMRGGAQPVDLTISNEGNRQLIDVAGGQVANGVPVDIYRPNGGPNQLWHLRNLRTVNGVPLYRMESFQRGRDGRRYCVDVEGGQTSQHPGSYLNVWACHGANGEPAPGGWQRDTQNLHLIHPVYHWPNIVMFVVSATGLFAKVLANGHLSQSYRQSGSGAGSEHFYLHPFQPSGGGD
ncbi:endonuclease/exonuclease/phosphatase family protein [Streptomyces sp. NPDC054765]